MSINHQVTIIAALGSVLLAGPLQAGYPVPQEVETSAAQLGLVEVVEERLVIGESTVVLGRVRNVGDSPVRYVSVGIAAFDADGLLLGTADGYVIGVACTDRDDKYRFKCIPPGEVGWFIGGFTNAQGIDRISSTATGYEVEAEPVSPVLVVEGDFERIQEYPGVLSLTGSVRNSGTTDAALVAVVAAFRDSSGALIDVEHTSIDGERLGGYSSCLRAGETAGFTLRSHIDPSSFSDAEIRFFWEKRDGRFDYGIAGVAHIAGYDGSVWRSSLAVANCSGADGRCAITYYGGQGPVVAEVALADNQLLSWDDVLATLLGVEEDTAGYLRITCDVPVSITARTWNDQASGGLGQQMLTLQYEDLLWEGDPGLLSPLMGGEAFRSNIGLVNFGGGTCPIRILLFDQQGNQIIDHGRFILAPRSWQQLNDVLPDGITAGYAIIEQPDWVCSLWAYVSLIDRRSGDPTTVPVDPITTIGPFPDYIQVGGTPGW